MRYLILALTLLFFVLGSLMILPNLPATAQGGWTTYQDNHPLILARMSGTWQTTIDSYADGNSRTSTSAGGGTLVIEFEGTGIEIVYAQLPNSSIDGTFTGQLDEFDWGATSTYAATPTYGLILRQTGLAHGVHTLTLMNVNGLLALDAIRIEGGLLTSSSIPPDTPTPAPFIPTPPPLETMQGFSTLNENSVIVSTTTELLEAIAEANLQPNTPVTIYLTEGDYVLSPAQRLVLGSRITLQGTGETWATIRREQNATLPLIIVGGYPVELHHLIIKQSNTLSRNYAGGIYNLGPLKIFDSRIESNQVLNGGAGIMNDATATLTIERTVFTDNYAGAGAAIQNEGGHLDINCSIFTNNLAHYGAGLLNARTTGSVVIRNSLFSGNVAEWPEFSGAGIYNLSSEVTVDAAHNEWVNNTPGDTAGATIITSPTKPFDTTACAPLPAPPLPAECPASFGIQEETTVLSPECQPPVTPLPTLTHTPSPTPPGADACVVRLTAAKNAYREPYEARTERFDGQPVTTLTPQNFPSGIQLRLDRMYERNGNEKFVYKIGAYNLSPAETDIYDPLNFEVTNTWTEVTGMNLWINSKSGLDFVLQKRTDLEQVVNMPTPTLCSSTTMQDESPQPPTGNINTIEQIRDYGVEVDSNVLRTQGKNFTTNELTAILGGVSKTAQAFLVVHQQKTPSSTKIAHTVFRERMTDPNSQYYDYFQFERNRSENCKTEEKSRTHGELVTIDCGIMTNPNGGFWITYPELKINAVVHELGHAFEIRTDHITRNTIKEDFTLTDCNLQPVMGNMNPWQRGERGWGSSGDNPNYGTPQNTTNSNRQYYSPFQQNTSETPNEGPGEATADMFLNWVYRVTSPISTIPAFSQGTVDQTLACSNDTVQGTWEGFRNIDETGTKYDISLPGNRRYWWMHSQMVTLIP